MQVAGEEFVENTTKAQNNCLSREHAVNGHHLASYGDTPQAANIQNEPRQPAHGMPPVLPLALLCQPDLAIFGGTCLPKRAGPQIWRCWVDRRRHLAGAHPAAATGSGRTDDRRPWRSLTRADGEFSAATWLQEKGALPSSPTGRRARESCPTPGLEAEDYEELNTCVAYTAGRCRRA